MWNNEINKIIYKNIFVDVTTQLTFLLNLIIVIKIKKIKYGGNLYSTQNSKVPARKKVNLMHLLPRY